MPPKIKRHFPPNTMRCRFSPERVICPSVFALKMTFPPEGPLFSAVAPGYILPTPGPIREAIRSSARNKLKHRCLEVLHWDDDQFQQVEVSSNALL
jgi:hypothetical protein